MTTDSGNSFINSNKHPALGCNQSPVAERKRATEKKGGRGRGGRLMNIKMRI